MEFKVSPAVVVGVVGVNAASTLRSSLVTQNRCDMQMCSSTRVILTDVGMLQYIHYVV